MQDLLTAIQAADAQQVGEAWRTYQQIVSSEPSLEGDGDRLRTAMSVLGITVDQLRLHLQMVQQWRLLKALRDGLPDARAKMNAAREAFAEARAKHKLALAQIEADLNAARNASWRASDVYERHSAADVEAYGIEQRWEFLLSPTTSPFVPAGLADLQRQLEDAKRDLQQATASSRRWEAVDPAALQDEGGTRRQIQRLEAQIAAATLSAPPT